MAIFKKDSADFSGVKEIPNFGSEFFHALRKAKE